MIFRSTCVNPVITQPGYLQSSSNWPFTSLPPKRSRDLRLVGGIEGGG